MGNAKLAVEQGKSRRKAMRPKMPETTPKHTPGPWTFRKGGPVRVEGVNIDGMSEFAHPHIVCIYNDEQGRRCTAFVAECASATLDNEANARLIAAAPDLLAAAEAAIGRLEAWSQGHEKLAGHPLDERFIHDQLRSMAGNFRILASNLRAAIAKAKGKS